MAHVFQQFRIREVETVEIKVGNNTKKAVNEAIEQIQERTKASKSSKGSNNHVLIKVDASEVKDIKKVLPLIANSVHLFGNIDFMGIFATQVFLADELQCDEIIPEDEKHFIYLKGFGSGHLEKLGERATAINEITNRQLTALLVKLQEIQERYVSIIEDAKDSSENEQVTFKRRFNFKTRNTNLLDFFKKCFNEIDRLLSPGNCINPNPSFQRDLVWSVEKKQSFIKSICEEIPIGSFYVNDSPDYDPLYRLGEGCGSVLYDGKQRMHTLLDFFLGKFPVEINGKWLYYKDAPIFFMYKMQDCSISVYESSYTNLRDIIETYVVINSAQVKHTDEDLQKAIDLLHSQSIA